MTPRGRGAEAKGVIPHPSTAAAREQAVQRTLQTGATLPYAPRMARTSMEPGQIGMIRTDGYTAQGEKIPEGDSRRPATYQAVAYYGGGDGTRKRKKASGPSRTAAERALRASIRAAVQAEREAAEDGAREEVVPREWTAHVRYRRAHLASERSGLRESSKRIYLNHLDNYLVRDRPVKKGEEPKAHRFDGRRLDSLTVGELEAWLEELAQERGNGVVHTVHTLVSQMFERAHRLGVVAVDPTAGLKKPKRTAETRERLRREEAERAAEEGREPKEEQDHTRALTEEEVGRLLSFMETDKLAQRNLLPFIAGLMLSTGARIGEVLALRGEDLDMTTSPASLRIRATVARRAGEGLYLQEGTKTRSGMRTVQVPSRLAQDLSEHWRADRERHAMEPTWNPLGLLLPSEAGTIRDRANTHNKLRRVFNHPDVRLGWAIPHTFRRTHITLLLNLGYSPLQVAYLAGHSDASLTLKVYGDSSAPASVRSEHLENLWAPSPAIAEASEGDQIVRAELEQMLVLEAK